MLICKVDGCGRDAARKGAALCEMHYYRHRRRGDFERREPMQSIPHSHGYVLRYAPDHPLTKRHTGPYEYEHRLVYFGSHGAGPFACHWCNEAVTWDNMHVDHLNDVKHDNTPSNLVASCPVCNQHRGVEKMRRTCRERRAVQITWNGVTRPAIEWAEDLGITRSSLMARLKAGWPLDRVMTEPRGVSGPRRAA